MPNDNNGKNTLGGEITCIKVTRDTRAKLAELGKKGDTYETVINSLLETECVKTGDSDEPL